MPNSPISICIPVLNRYDCLRGLLISLLDSTIKPRRVLIIDNGNNPSSLSAAVTGLCGVHKLPIATYSQIEPLGLAASWNYFIHTSRDDHDRIITNDNITFAPHSIATMQSSSADLVFPVNIGFSCFLIRDSCIDRLGLFDETLSPGFAYFEDCDYMMRKDAYNISNPNSPIIVSDLPDTGIKHRGSATQFGLKSESEGIEYRRKFIIAQENYIAKWGELPKGLVRLS